MPFLTGPALWVIIALLCTNGVTGVLLSVKSADANRYKAELAASQATYTAFANQVRAQGEAAIEKAKVAVAEQARITERTIHAYANDLATLRTDYDRLRKQYARARGDGVSALPVAPTRIDEVPVDALPLAAECAETTLTLVALQDWVMEQAK